MKSAIRVATNAELRIAAVAAHEAGDMQVVAALSLIAQFPCGDEIDGQARIVPAGNLRNCPDVAGTGNLYSTREAAEAARGKT